MLGVFALSGLLDTAEPASTVPRTGDGFDMRRIAAKEYRFPVPSLTAVRLPKDISRLANLGVSEADWPLCWAALANPTYRVPLLARDGARRAALLAATTSKPGEIAIAQVTLGVRPGPRRHSPPEIVEYEGRIARDRDDMLDLLEGVWADAHPMARAAAGGLPAIWLGGDPAAVLEGGDIQVEGVCATFGLRAEIVRDASRHVRQVATRIGDRPPSHLIVWRPASRDVGAAVKAFRDASAEGELIELDEPSLPDALLELRWNLADLELLDGPPVAEKPSETLLPNAGEERFYTKIRGSKVGDVMIEVADCGHNKWGSDVRRLAPRAYKGIAAKVGAKPRALFRCSSCGKHRWRARY